MIIERTIDGVKFNIALTSTEVKEAYKELQHDKAIKIIRNTINSYLSKLDKTNIKKSNTLTIAGNKVKLEQLENLTEENISIIADKMIQMIYADDVCVERLNECSHIALALFLQTKK